MHELYSGVTGRPSPAESAVELRAVARRFARRWALRGVTLAVAPGEVLAVVGHNGSGKTTLLRIVATALRPTMGGGTVCGRDLVREPGQVREVVALLGHRPGLYDDLTAAENLVFAARMLGIADEARAVAGALEQVELASEANERVRTFSSGMQRRLSLARVLLQAPRVLLLDEPFHSFDAAGVALVNDVIRSTKERGGAVMIVAHDIDRAAGTVDRTVELAKGIVLEDVPAEPGLHLVGGRRAVRGRV